MAAELLGIPEMADINDVLDVINIRQGARRKRVTRYDPFDDLSDTEFRQRYRLTKNTVKYVISLVEDQLKPAKKARSDAISASLQVLIALRYYAKGSYQTEVCDIHNVNQSTVSKIIAKVSRAIASLLPRFIKFPQRPNETKLKFFNIAQFPNVIGSIDCTHIRIKNPKKEEALLYCNRKGYYSLNVQVVCDADCKILDIVARRRGSAHDSRIWNECSLKEKFEAGTVNGLLLGDNGYPCSHFLLTPIQNPSSAAEEAYNRAHISTRNTIERCFGQWKSMFRALYKIMEISLPNAKPAIIAMAVLYNIRKMHGEDEDYPDEEDDDIDDPADDSVNMDDNAPLPIPLPTQQHPLQIPRGNIFRRQFIRRNFGGAED